MDCMTISTFRSLEQQAVRQFKETKLKETNNKFVSKETFGQEKLLSTKINKTKNELNTETTNKGKINYYA